MSSGFGELVAATTIGLATRPFRGEPPPGMPTPADAATGVLDASAVYAVARRAGLETLRDVPARRPAAPPEERAEVGRAFSSTLLAVLGDPTNRGSQSPWTRARAAVIAEALGWVEQADSRLPHRLLVPILSALAEQPGVLAESADVLGQRGRWLAAQVPAWAALLAGPPERSGPQAWELGSTEERLAELRRVRRADPDAGRALLAASRGDSAQVRAAFVGVLAEDVQAADEELLASFAKDRSAHVAAAAADALLRLGGSGMVLALMDLARHHLHVRAGMLGRRLAAEFPGEGALPAPLGRRSWTSSPGESRLNAVVAGVPPQHWPDLVGATAAELLTMSRASGRLNLVPGLTDAALRWHDPELAKALLKVGALNPALLGVVEPEARAPLGRDLLRLLNGPALAEAIEAWPQPWSEDNGRLLAAAAIEYTKRKPDLAVPAWIALATRLPIRIARGWANSLRAVADERRGGVAPARQAAELLTLRSALFERLQDPHADEGYAGQP